MRNNFLKNAKLSPGENAKIPSVMPKVLVILPESFRLYQDNLSGIRRRLGNEWRIHVADCDPSVQEITQQLSFWHPDGCIVVAARGHALDALDVLSRYPTVFLDRTPFTPGQLLDVCQNYDDNGRLAATTLFDPGIDNYAFVGSNQNPHWSKARGQAFRRSIQALGKKCLMFEGSHKHAKRFKYLSHWLSTIPKPIGIFTANDATAAEVHAICTSMGLKIPEDIPLLGIDDDVQTCETTVPKISSIHPDFEMAGWICADLLCDRLANPRLKSACRLYSTQGVTRRESLKPQTLGCDAIVHTAIRTIHARACEGLSVDDVAAIMGYSRRMAEIRFRKATNRTIKSLITEVRIERAKVLIRNRGLSLDEISRACGYGTTNALRIAYRKFTGLSLTAARKGFIRGQSLLV